MVWFLLVSSIVAFLLSFIPLINLYVAVPIAILVEVGIILYFKKTDKRKILITAAIFTALTFVTSFFIYYYAHADSKANLKEVEKEMEDFDKHFEDMQ